MIEPTRGFLIGRLPIDLVGRPSMLVCEGMERLFVQDPVLRSSVTISMDPEGPQDVTVAILRTFERRTGAASRTMDALADLCDRHGVTIRLQSCSLRTEHDADALDQQALDAFYGRRGFVPDDANWRAYAMIRRPTPSGEASSTRMLTRTEIDAIARHTAEMDARIDAASAGRTPRTTFAARRAAGSIHP